MTNYKVGQFFSYIQGVSIGVGLLVSIVNAITYTGIYPSVAEFIVDTRGMYSVKMAFSFTFLIQGFSIPILIELLRLIRVVPRSKSDYTVWVFNQIFHTPSIPEHTRNKRNQQFVKGIKNWAGIAMTLFLLISIPSFIDYKDSVEKSNYTLIPSEELTIEDLDDKKIWISHDSEIEDIERFLVDSHYVIPFITITSEKVVHTVYVRLPMNRLSDLYSKVYSDNPITTSRNFNDFIGSLGTELTENEKNTFQIIDSYSVIAYSSDDEYHQYDIKRTLDALVEIALIIMLLTFITGVVIHIIKFSKVKAETIIL